MLLNTHAINQIMLCNFGINHLVHNQYFANIFHFLPHDTHVYVRVLGGKATNTLLLN